jgi:hypothetical protein
MIVPPDVDTTFQYTWLASETMWSVTVLYEEMTLYPDPLCLRSKDETLPSLVAKNAIVGLTLKAVVATIPDWFEELARFVITPVAMSCMFTSMPITGGPDPVTSSVQ